MGKYLGADIPVSIGGTSVGQLVDFDIPDEEFDRIDATGIADSYPDTKLADIPNASEVDLLVYFDRSDSDQTTLDGYNGDDTARDLVITFPWTTNNTYTQSVKVFNLSQSRVAKKETLQRTISVVTVGAGVWSTV